MNWEENIINLNWVHSMRESVEIFILEVLEEEEWDVEDAVHAVPNNVESQEIEGQSNHTLSSEIEDDLRVEGDAPCCKINPSDNHRNED